MSHTCTHCGEAFEGFPFGPTLQDRWCMSCWFGYAEAPTREERAKFYDPGDLGHRGNQTARRIQEIDRQIEDREQKHYAALEMVRAAEAELRDRKAKAARFEREINNLREDRERLIPRRLSVAA